MQYDFSTSKDKFVYSDEYTRRKNETYITIKMILDFSLKCSKLEGDS